MATVISIGVSAIAQASDSGDLGSFPVSSISELWWMK
jgi:hypothetical protein